MESQPEAQPSPATQTQQRLLKFSRRMWWIPLSLATLVLLAFFLTDSLVFAGLGVIIFELGALAAIAGIIATLVVVAQRKRPEDGSEDLHQKKAFHTLGLLLSNFAVAGLYTYAGITLIGTSITDRAISPSGRYIAELSHLNENDSPPYGQAVSLRPVGNPFKIRKKVFSGYCERIPTLHWVSDQELDIHCARPSHVTIRESAYRSITVHHHADTIAPEKTVPKKSRQARAITRNTRPETQ